MFGLISLSPHSPYAFAIKKYAVFNIITGRSPEDGV